MRLRKWHLIFLISYISGMLLNVTFSNPLNTNSTRNSTVEETSSNVPSQGWNTTDGIDEAGSEDGLGNNTRIIEGDSKEKPSIPKGGSNANDDNNGDGFDDDRNDEIKNPALWKVIVGVGSVLLFVLTLCFISHCILVHKRRYAMRAVEKMRKQDPENPLTEDAVEVENESESGENKQLLADYDRSPVHSPVSVSDEVCLLSKDEDSVDGEKVSTKNEKEEDTHHLKVPTIVNEIDEEQKGKNVTNYNPLKEKATIHFNPPADSRDEPSSSLPCSNDVCTDDKNKVHQTDIVKDAIVNKEISQKQERQQQQQKEQPQQQQQQQLQQQYSDNSVSDTSNDKVLIKNNGNGNLTSDKAQRHLQDNICKNTDKNTPLELDKNDKKLDENKLKNSMGIIEQPNLPTTIIEIAPVDNSKHTLHEQMQSPTANVDPPAANTNTNPPSCNANIKLPTVNGNVEHDENQTLPKKVNMENKIPELEKEPKLMPNGLVVNEQLEQQKNSPQHSSGTSQNLKTDQNLKTASDSPGIKTLPGKTNQNNLSAPIAMKKNKELVVNGVANKLDSTPVLTDNCNHGSNASS